MQQALGSLYFFNAGVDFVVISVFVIQYVVNTDNLDLIRVAQVFTGRCFVCR